MSQKTICIKTYTSVAEAELAENLLKSAGVEAYVSDVHNPYPMVATPIGIRLQVKEDDVKKAVEILNSTK